MVNKINEDNADSGSISSYDYFKEAFTSLVDKFTQKDPILAESDPITDKSLENTADITPVEIIAPITQTSSKEAGYLEMHTQTK